ncbi:MAG TPA: DEAD/DEAH box helicase [Planctomycetota bacterium]|nr:DEAD/DEAH box helicase [Planctomycetota bacterium]
MPLIPDRTLESVTASDIPGAATAPVGTVREIRRSPTALVARMKDARVTISADFEEADCTACPALPCPHFSAALLAWVKKRVPVRAPKRLGLVDRLLSSPGWKDADHFAQDYFRGASGDVDVQADGSLVIRLRAGRRQATFELPADDAPGFLWNLPKGISKSEKLRGIRVSRKPISPELRAEYDDKRRIVLRPVWGNGVRPDPEARWHFDGSSYQALDTVPRDLKGYFKGERVIDEDDIPQFIESEFRALLRQPSFKPTKDVEETKIAPRPTLSALRVKDETGDWLELDPIYMAGDVRLAMSEILAVQGKRKFIRKGNTYIPAEPVKAYAGPTRMRRVEFILNKPDLAIEGDLPEFDPHRTDAPPKGFGASLRSYQQTGYDWMRYLRRAGLHGVLADDMGLGKTHQTMAFLLSTYEDGAKRPSLIVAPTSVLDSWMQKIRDFAPALRPYRYYGAERRPEILRLPGQRAIVTTYTVLARDIDYLSSMEWETVVLDEAQYIKTSSTLYAQAAKRLSAKTRLALTGTPIENRLDELWSIFQFVLPGLLGSQQSFRERFEIPIIRNNDFLAKEKLKKLIAPFKLRRVKSEVLQDLPPKVEDVRMCELSAHQAALYRALVERDGERLADALRDQGKKIDYISVFAALSKLKRICDHPALVVKGPRTMDLHSGKFEVFKELIQEALDSGQKVVVFTQYLEMMNIIEDYLRHLRVDFAEIRGDSRERADAIKRFNENEQCKVFVCSLMAGGVGIDLTSASVVIHYDRWWNAAREDQATDRVHRWGQTRGVQVFKLLTRGTLEEKIDKMIAAKGDLMNSIVDVDAGTFTRFGRDELIDLLTGARRAALASA